MVNTRESEQSQVGNVMRLQSPLLIGPAADSLLHACDSLQIPTGAALCEASNANQERFYAICTLLCDSKGYTQQPAPAIPAPFLPEQSIMVRAHIDGLRSTPPFQPTAPHDKAGIHTQDVPLPELFRQAQTLVGQAAAMSATEAESRARQAEALRALARCDQLVDSLALFSRCLSIERAFAFFTHLWCGG
jgi:hypothetical protein